VAGERRHIKLENHGEIHRRIVCRSRLDAVGEMHLGADPVIVVIAMGKIHAIGDSQQLQLGRAAARASRSKRATPSGSRARPAGSTLMATSRFNRVSRARQTSPIPPRPSSSTISKLPSLAPALSALNRRQRGTFQEGLGLLIRQRLHYGAEFGIFRARLRQECSALLRRLRQRGLI